MKKIAKKKNDDRWLIALGDHIRHLIEERGYKSPYEFWIQNVGDEISRTTLQYILTGQVDMKVGTLKKIAEALELSPSEVLKFSFKK